MRYKHRQADNEQQKKRTQIRSDIGLWSYRECYDGAGAKAEQLLWACHDKQQRGCSQSDWNRQPRKAIG
jgi:hypothetical protein